MTFHGLAESTLPGGPGDLAAVKLRTASPARPPRADWDIGPARLRPRLRQASVLLTQACAQAIEAS